jgi:hypothetical protein
VQVPVYVVLLHYPIQNRRGDIVATSVTNLDIHDISRTACTYGAKRLFMVTPIEDQHRLVNRVLEHWSSEGAQKWHRDRSEAISLVQLAHSFDEVKAEIEKETGTCPEVVLTDARSLPKSVSYREYRKELEERQEGSPPLALVLGTGWGVASEFYPEVDRILDPIYGPTGEKGYNHLSVRAAAAAIMDRLFGQ